MSKTKIRPLTRAWLPLIFAVGFSGSAIAEETARRFEIASQDLATALNQFAVAADCQIVFAPELVRDMRSPAVNGTFTPEEVIRRLLKGTELNVRAIGPGTYAVEARTAQPATGKPVSEKASSAIGAAVRTTRSPRKRTLPRMASASRRNAKTRAMSSRPSRATMRPFPRCWWKARRSSTWTSRVRATIRSRM
jgi:hypothetical protein